MSDTLLCPDHQKPMRLIEGRFGPFFVCDERACDLKVGAHPNGEPKGIPADQETRDARKRAHTAFDCLWLDDPNRKKARSKAYAWLTKALGLGHVDDCHIALFDSETCDRVVELCNAKRMEDFS